MAAITKRFFTKAPVRARVYYLLDGPLLFGFFLIMFTGLIISTWLNLSLGNFTPWLNIHITISIATLVTLLLILILHWRWIANVARNIWSRPAASPVGTAVKQPARVRPGRVGRCELLKVLGLTGAASILALSSASKALAETLAENEEYVPAEGTAAAGNATETATGVSTATENATAEESTSAETATPIQETPQASTEAVVQSNPSSAFSTSCTVRCDKDCSYPGHCPKYTDSNTDSNNNGRSDLGDCI